MLAACRSEDDTVPFFLATGHNTEQRRRRRESLARAGVGVSDFAATAGIGTTIADGIVKADGRSALGGRCGGMYCLLSMQGPSGIESG